jgi:predicted chitinase
MDWNLPSPQEQQKLVNPTFSNLLKKGYQLLVGNPTVSPLERFWSFVTVGLGTICLLMIFAITYQPAQDVISPIVSSIRKLQIFNKKLDYEQFTFAPGWSYNKLHRIDYNGLKTLAFFDLPVNDDGTLHTDNDGYQTLKSQEAKDLFYTAHQNGAKVTLTFTQVNNPDIRRILNNPQAQETLISQAIAEVKEADVDGATIDFEYTGPVGGYYRRTFTQFVKNFTERMHKEIPGSQVSLALGIEPSATSLYDVPELAKTVDKVFIMAYNFAVPEVKDSQTAAPLHGYNYEEYMQNISEYLHAFAQYIPDNKIVLERAWYGSGENYPLYASDKNRDTTKYENTLSTPLSSEVINRLLLDVPVSARAAARKNLPLIAEALEKEGLLTSNVLAYALATIEHETAGTFEPIDEFKGRKSARRLGYEGGTAYFGRGFIQLTHARNYKKMGERIGMGDALVKNPELASDPVIAAKVLAAFFQDNGTARAAINGDFVSARMPINPDRQGWWIASLAVKYLAQI